MQVSQEDRITPQDKSSSTNAVTIAAIAILAIVAIGAYYYFSDSTQDVPAPPPVVTAPVVVPEVLPAEPLPTVSLPEPEIIDEPTAPVTPSTLPEIIEPLPALAESDDYIEQKTLAVTQGMAIAPLIIKKDMARQFVVFIDNLAQGELVRKASPIKGPEQKFVAIDIGTKIYLNPDSYHRYDIYADMLTKLNGKELVTTYQTLSPLFEEAFVELGYSDINFDARMQQAIKSILAAPTIEDPIELSSVSVNYKFVDPNLESLPNAQKLMLRMGPENSRKVKEALRTLQAELDR